MLLFAKLMRFGRNATEVQDAVKVLWQCLPKRLRTKVPRIYYKVPLRNLSREELKEKKLSRREQRQGYRTMSRLPRNWRGRPTTNPPLKDMLRDLYKAWGAMKAGGSRQPGVMPDGSISISQDERDQYLSCVASGLYAEAVQDFIFGTAGREAGQRHRRVDRNRPHGIQSGPAL